MKKQYNREAIKIIEKYSKRVSVFQTDGKNIDASVVENFGEEWLKFKDYSDNEIRSAGNMYFDILNDQIVNKSTYGLDIGCGTGRWTKFLSDKIGFIEAIDPSDSIFAAAELLKNVENVRLAKASIENIPFDDETFDFVMSIGVLHHIPDTQAAMKDCVKKVKKNGYFFCYLYYNLETKNFIYHFLFWISNTVRIIVSQFPSTLRKVTCDMLAVVFYMPFVLVGRFLNNIGLKKIAKKLPLYDYVDKTFFVIRNDSLDRFGTNLEQRFSKEEVIQMMKNCGLSDIVVSPSSPFYHAVGKKTL